MIAGGKSAPIDFASSGERDRNRCRGVYLQTATTAASITTSLRIRLNVTTPSRVTQPLLFSKAAANLGALLFAGFAKGLLHGCFGVFPGLGWLGLRVVCA